MDKLSLRVFLFGAIVRVANELKQAKVPEFTTYELETPAAEDALAAVPNDLDAVVVTESLDLIAELLSVGHALVKIVYVGREEELVERFGSVPEQIVELWSPNNSPLQYRYRFERLLERLKTRYDAWLYREWLMSLIDSLPDIIWFKEASGLHNLVNAEFCNTVHKTREETKDQGHCFIWNAPPESEYQCAETDHAVMTGGHLVIADEPVETDAGLRQFRTYKSPVHGRTGEIIGTVGLGHDVTDFTNLGMEMQILMDNLPYPVALADNSWRIVSTNEPFREAFGLTAEEAEGLDYPAWKATLDTEVTEREAPDGSKLTLTDYVAVVNGERHVYEVSEPEIRDYFDNVSGHYCLFHDVTAVRAYERQTMQFANTDALTGLANRRRFHRYLEDHIGQPMGLLYLDLDHFKDVNDTLGHAKGDEVLERAAQLIERVLEGGLVSRQGGDEFAFALPGVTDVNTLVALADRVREAIRTEFSHLNMGLDCSVGIATTQTLDSDPAEFVRQADRRMYEQKAIHHAEQA